MTDTNPASSEDMWSRHLQQQQQPEWDLSISSDVIGSDRIHALTCLSQTRLRTNSTHIWSHRTSGAAARCPSAAAHVGASASEKESECNFFCGFCVLGFFFPASGSYLHRLHAHRPPDRRVSGLQEAVLPPLNPLMLQPHTSSFTHH